MGPVPLPGQDLMRPPVIGGYEAMEQAASAGEEVAPELRTPTQEMVEGLLGPTHRFQRTPAAGAFGPIGLELIR